MKTILLDTSFLDSLAVRERTFHEQAKAYFSYFAKNKCRLLLSTIVIAEYATQHSVDNLYKLYPFEIIGFDLHHAERAKEINFIKYKQHRTGNRNCFKDDLKIIAQAVCIQNLDYLITGDNGFYKFLEKQKVVLGFDSNFQPIHFHQLINHYFSLA